MQQLVDFYKENGLTKLTVKVLDNFYKNPEPNLIFFLDLNQPINIKLDTHLEIKRVTKDNLELYSQDVYAIRQTVNPNFSKAGNVGLISYYDGVPCAFGVEFHESRVINSLNLDKKTLYVGDFFVRNEYRRKSIYSAMLCHIATSATDYEQLCLEIAKTNTPSIKGS